MQGRVHSQSGDQVVQGEADAPPQLGIPQNRQHRVRGGRPDGSQDRRAALQSQHRDGQGRIEFLSGHDGRRELAQRGGERRNHVRLAEELEDRVHDSGHGGPQSGNGQYLDHCTADRVTDQNRGRSTAQQGGDRVGDLLVGVGLDGGIADEIGDQAGQGQAGALQDRWAEQGGDQVADGRVDGVENVVIGLQLRDHLGQDVGQGAGRGGERQLAGRVGQHGGNPRLAEEFRQRRPQQCGHPRDRRGIGQQLLDRVAHRRTDRRGDRTAGQHVGHHGGDHVGGLYLHGVVTGKPGDQPGETGTQRGPESLGAQQGAHHRGDIADQHVLEGGFLHQFRHGGLDLFDQRLRIRADQVSGDRTRRRRDRAGHIGVVHALDQRHQRENHGAGEVRIGQQRDDRATDLRADRHRQRIAAQRRSDEVGDRLAREGLDRRVDDQIGSQLGDEITDSSEQRGATEERVHRLGDDGLHRDDDRTDRQGRLVQRGQQGVHDRRRQVGAHPRIEHELLVGGPDQGAQRIGDTGQEVGHIGRDDRGDLRDAGVALPQQRGGDQLAGIRCQGGHFRRRRGDEVRRDLAQHDVDRAGQCGADLDLDRRAAEEDLESGQHAVVQQIGDRLFDAPLPDEDADPFDGALQRERRNLGQHRIGDSLLDDGVAERLLDEIGDGVADRLAQRGGSFPLGGQKRCHLVGDERQERGVVDEFVEGRDDTRPVADHHIEQDVVADVPDQRQDVRRQHDGRGFRHERLDGAGDLGLELLDGPGDRIPGVGIRRRGGRQWHARPGRPGPIGSCPIGSRAAEQQPGGTAVTTRPAAVTTGTTVTTGADQPGATAGTARTTVTGRAGRRGTVTALAAVAEEQPGPAAVAPGAPVDAGDPGTARAAVAEPSGRPAVTAVETVAAVADQTAVAAVTGPRGAGTAVAGEAVAVSVQNAGVGVLGSAVADEEPNERGDRVGRYGRRGFRCREITFRKIHFVRRAIRNCGRRIHRLPRADRRRWRSRRHGATRLPPARPRCHQRLRSPDQWRVAGQRIIDTGRTREGIRAGDLAFGFRRRHHRRFGCRHYRSGRLGDASHRRRFFPRRASSGVVGQRLIQQPRIVGRTGLATRPGSKLSGRRRYRACAAGGSRLPDRGGCADGGRGGRDVTDNRETPVGYVDGRFGRGPDHTCPPIRARHTGTDTRTRAARHWIRRTRRATGGPLGPGPRTAAPP